MNKRLFSVGSIIRCIVETAGKLANRASVSIPSVPIELPFMSERDLDDIKICIEQKIDVIIVPGVRGGENVIKFREQLGKTQINYTIRI